MYTHFNSVHKNCSMLGCGVVVYEFAGPTATYGGAAAAHYRDTFVSLNSPERTLTKRSVLRFKLRIENTDRRLPRAFGIIVFYAFNARASALQLRCLLLTFRINHTN